MVFVDYESDDYAQDHPDGPLTPGPSTGLGLQDVPEPKRTISYRARDGETDSGGHVGIISTTTTNPSSERDNPNRNAFSACLSCYP